MTECNQSSFGFKVCGSREIVARFDGGTISSDGGALLLRETDRRLNLLPRLAQSFLEEFSGWASAGSSGAFHFGDGCPASTISSH